MHEVLDVLVRWSSLLPWWGWLGVAYALTVLLPEDRKQRLLHILIALDQLAWVVLTLGKGSPDETISAAAWRMEQQGKLAGRVLRPLIDAIFSPLEREHCRLSYESELAGAQLPLTYRKESTHG